MRRVAGLQDDPIVHVIPLVKFYGSHSLPIPQVYQIGQWIIRIDGLK
jgi:hypothetical protein